MIETGLGGRLDATNVLSPAATVITDISMDHAEILGDTLDKIAFEKAGIIKSGIPNVVGLLPPEAKKVIVDISRRRKAPVVLLKPADFKIARNETTLDFKMNGLKLDNFTSSLKGPHQLKNCALALKTIAVLREQGFHIPRRAVETGLKNTVWPGRFQIMTNGAGGPTLVLDVCHNAAGVAAFVDTFRLVFPGRHCRVLMGFVRRKQHQEMIDQLSRIAGEFRIVPLKSKRTVDVKSFVAEMNWHGVPANRSARLSTGYSALSKKTSPGDIVAVIGSHYLVGEFLAKYAVR